MKIIKSIWKQVVIIIGLTCLFFFWLVNTGAEVIICKYKKGLIVKHKLDNKVGMIIDTFPGFKEFANDKDPAYNIRFSNKEGFKTEYCKEFELEPNESKEQKRKL